MNHLSLELRNVRVSVINGTIYLVSFSIHTPGVQYGPYTALGIAHYATHLFSFLIGTFLPGSSGVMRHVRGLYEKYEVDKGLKSLHGL